MAALRLRSTDSKEGLLRRFQPIWQEEKSETRRPKSDPLRLNPYGYSIRGKVRTEIASESKFSTSARATVPTRR